MKKLFSVLLIAVLLLSLCACRPAESKENTLAFVHRYGSGAYDSHLADGFTEAAKALGFAPTVVTPADATATAQKTLIENLIREGVAGIAINANEVSGLETVLKEANDAGIPVITVSADTAGSQLLVQPSSPELVGKSLMDAMFDLTGGEGSFAVISGANSFSGHDQWVSGMELAARDSKYRKVQWVETNFGGNLDGSKEEMKALLTEIINKYPDLEAICCVGGSNLPLCSQVLEEMGSKIRVTGMAQPSQMKDLVGSSRACPYYFQWNPALVGSCAAHALIALLDNPALEENGKLITELAEYPLYPGYFSQFQIYAGAPFCFEGLPTDPNY
jgi:rhamnose transport system substrate-binding protein